MGRAAKELFAQACGSHAPDAGRAGPCLLSNSEAADESALGHLRGRRCDTERFV